MSHTDNKIFVFSRISYKFFLPFFSSLFDRVLFDPLFADETDVSHVPEVLVEVEGVPDYELVRDLKRDVVRSVPIALSKLKLKN